MAKKLGVYLLSYKRPDFIQEAIESILKQDYADFDLLISENSPDDSVIDVLSKYTSAPRVQIIKRSSSLPSLQHFNTVLQEAQANYQYAMLFHDDDIMLPNALTQLMTCLETNKHVSAVSCNAYFIQQKAITENLFCAQLKNPVEITSVGQIISHYILKGKGHTPFPTYIYRTKYLNGINLNFDDGGKYSDVSFLIKLMEKAPFIWLSNPLILYRLHSANDSAQVNLHDILKLSRFYFKKSPTSFPLIVFFICKQLTKKLFFRK